jgi:DNA (cytosine-5)-methyltransferase 1
MKLGSLFDGIGGSLLSATLIGIEPVWASEIEPFPIKVTKHHFPNVNHLGDITKIKGDEIEQVDIIVGGSPCQDLSVAGKRAGMKHAEFGDEETTRSGLFMEQIRIVKEMRNATNKPRYMVWENVPGAFSSNNGEDFRAVLEETARVADPTVSIPRSVNGWANAGSILADGFTISWRTVDAQYWGVPQRRRRIYLVADFGGQSAPEILFESEGLHGHIAESRSEGQRIAEDAERCVNSAIAVDAYNHSLTGDVAVTLTAASGSSATHSGPMVLNDQGGSVMDVSDKVATLRAEMHGNIPAVCYGISAYESNSMKSSNPHSGIYEADTSRTLDQNGGTPACNQGGIMVCEPTLIEMTSTKNTIVEDGICPTLTARMGTGGNQVNAVCYGEGGYGDYVENRISTIKAQGGVLGGGSESFISSNKQVRRLTPLECERLQGYPDGYTNIPGASDSARYKSLGNSFAIPNIKFVIKSIARYINEIHN